MDFVIAGFVIGGLLVACGVFVRDLGPRVLAGSLRRKRADCAPKRDSAWKRYCVAVGSLITGGGLLVVLVTVLGIVLSVPDSVGNTMVMLATVAALGCVALAVVVVTPHYRKGGFEPRPVPEIAVEMAKTIARPQINPVDDLFSTESPEEPVATPVDDPVVPGVPEIDVSTDIAAAALEPFLEPATEPPTDMPAESESDNTPESLVELDSANEFGEQWLPEEPHTPIVDVITPVAASQRIYEQSVGSRAEPVPAPPPYVVDDEDLPAWNAPVPEREPPKPVVTSVPVRPTPPATPGGFQSSLLADLTESPDEPEDLTGTFKSRLLNELTRSQSPAPEPTVDVLLDEFSILPQQNGDGRNPGSNR